MGTEGSRVEDFVPSWVLVGVADTSQGGAPLEVGGLWGMSLAPCFLATVPGAAQLHHVPPPSCPASA